ncbi:Glycine cleavage system H protein [Schistosoma japonicum]|nr:Glycine cleavage system H protein [Schistosoma japonicum]
MEMNSGSVIDNQTEYRSHSYTSSTFNKVLSPFHFIRLKTAMCILLGRSASLISKAFQLSRTFTASHKLTSNVYYTKKHEWIKVDGDVGIVGISEYAEQKLGDIVYVELPVVGDTFSVNDQCAVVESVKAVSEIYSPASGTILEVNNDVTKNTKIINKSPLDEGWFFKLRLSDLSQIKDLLSEESYNEFLTSES